MKAISTGNRFTIHDDSLLTYDKLPADTYIVCFSKMSGFSLEKHPAPETYENKIYGDHNEKAAHVIKSFKRSPRNLGVILSGNKGIGKTLFAKVLGLKAIEENIPLLIVDKYIPGVANYISSIDQECMVFFDEFEKTFYEEDAKTEALMLFDGIAASKKLFVVTCNEMRRLSEYLVNRPGRFHYHFRFRYPNQNEVKTYMQEKLPKEYHDQIKAICSFTARIPLNYDCLRAIAFEITGGSTFAEAIQILNITSGMEPGYAMRLCFKDGTSLFQKHWNTSLLSDEETSITLHSDKTSDVCCISFENENATYNEETGVTIVNAEHIRIDWMDNELKEWCDRLNTQISHLEIRPTKERSIFYTV